MAWFADQGAQLHGQGVAWRDVSQPLPFPGARGRVDDLDAVGERSLDRVAALGADPARWFLAVDEELSRLARALVGRHREVEILPAVPVDITDLTETDEPAIGGDQGIGCEAPGRREQAGLRVPIPVGVAEADALLPVLVGKVEERVQSDA